MALKSSLVLGDLFYGLRQAGLSVSFSEWMALMEALDQDLIPPSLSEFYFIARSILIKDEALFDLWDQVFAAVLGDGSMPTAAAKELLEWLQEALFRCWM